jgi:uncharacterized membrane protein SpoIIM required for sporulation
LSLDELRKEIAALEVKISSVNATTVVKQETTEISVFENNTLAIVATVIAGLTLCIEVIAIVIKCRKH